MKDELEINIGRGYEVRRRGEGGEVSERGIERGGEEVMACLSLNCRYILLPGPICKIQTLFFLRLPTIR